VRRLVARILELARRTAFYLRKLVRNYRPTVQEQVIRGVAYGIGSGAVSLIILWWQTRQ